jgi:hypothetical protein
MKTAAMIAARSVAIHGNGLADVGEVLGAEVVAAVTGSSGNLHGFASRMRRHPTPIFESGTTIYSALDGPHQRLKPILKQAFFAAVNAAPPKSASDGPGTELWFVVVETPFGAGGDAGGYGVLRLREDFTS